MAEQKDPVLQDIEEVPVIEAGEEKEKISLSYEVENNGNLIRIRGEQEEILEVALKICELLDPSNPPTQSAKEYLLSNDDGLRPGGVYAVRFDRFKNEIWVQNRNAMGSQEYNDKMLVAVTSVIE